jgi:PAS domain S-box-containing protein
MPMQLPPDHGEHVADLHAMTRLQRISRIFIREGNMQAVFDEIVEAAMAITGADMGDLQVFDPQSGGLAIVAHRGLAEPWLDFWRRIGAGEGACGMALQRGERVIVEDVTQSPIFAGTPALDVQLAAGVRAVLSTPIRSRSGERLGILSTHFRSPHRPDERVLCLLDLLASQTADILERNRRETAMRALSKRYEAILQTVPDIIAEVDRNKVYTWLNQAGRQFFGDGVIGKEAAFYFEGEQDAKVQPLFEGQDDVFYVESWQRRQNGHKRLLAWWSHALKDAEGNVTGSLSTARDITERSQAEQALREREHLLSAITNTSPALIYIYDLETRSNVYCSAGMQRLLGYSPEEVAAMGEELFTRIIHPDDLPEAMADQARLLAAADSDVLETEYRAKGKDGAWRILHSRESVFLRGPDGSVRQKIGVAIDVTDQRKAEAEARARQAELAHVSRLNVIGELAAGLAHELNQPLTTILSGAELLLRMVQSPTRDLGELMGTLKEVGREAERAGQILRRFTSFVTRREVQRSAVNINDVIREAVALIALDARDRNVDVRLDLAEPIPSVQGDSVQLEQVVVNLLRNAVEAMEPHSDQRCVTITTRVRNGDVIEVAVRDTGKGVAPDAMNRLFEPFFTTKREGMGMGLAVSRSIIEAHAGRLWVEPNPDRGMTFRFTLPADGGRHRGDSEDPRTHRVCGG